MKSSRISGSELKITNLALNEMTLYHPGTLLLVARSGVLKHSLPLAILEVDATINQDIKALQVHGCNAFYLYYAILSQEDNIIRTLVKTGTTVQSLMMDSFLNIEIPTPDIDQQQSIIDKLAKLEKYSLFQTLIVYCGRCFQRDNVVVLYAPTAHRSPESGALDASQDRYLRIHLP